MSEKLYCIVAFPRFVVSEDDMSDVLFSKEEEKLDKTQEFFKQLYQEYENSKEATFGQIVDAYIWKIKTQENYDSSINYLNRDQPELQEYIRVTAFRKATCFINKIKGAYFVKFVFEGDAESIHRSCFAFFNLPFVSWVEP
jgi:hypothetical protein